MFEPEFDLTHRLTAQARASTPDSARDFFLVTPAPYLIEYPVSSAPWRVPPALLSPAPIASVSSLANNAHPRIPEKSAASYPPSSILAPTFAASGTTSLVRRTLYPFSNPALGLRGRISPHPQDRKSVV